MGAKYIVAAILTVLLAGCTSFQYARDQGGGCLASTMVGAAAGGIGGATIGAGTGQLAAIAGGTLLGGTLGYGINPACHEDPGYAPAPPIVTK
jgi:outer membrane lipoprotein SlyB